MQGIKSHFIPTEAKAKYINALLEVGFDTIDFGSFVSPKAIPQMRDTAEVLGKLHLNERSAKLLAIIANLRGATDALQFDEIDYLGFPFSISEIFQMRNTGKTIEQSIAVLESIIAAASTKNKKVVVYLSMGFGNPYGEKWNVDIVADWTEKLYQMGVEILSLSDTIGSSKPETIAYLFENLIPQYPKVEFGAHLHTTPTTWFEKVDAVLGIDHVLLGDSLGVRKICGLSPAKAGIVEISNALGALFRTRTAGNALVFVNVTGGLNDRSFKVARLPGQALHFSQRQELDIGVPADLDQFRRNDSHGTLVGGEGLVELGHDPTNSR